MKRALPNAILEEADDGVGAVANVVEAGKVYDLIAMDKEMPVRGVMVGHTFGCRRVRVPALVLPLCR